MHNSYSIMKTVLVLTLLAVTIACCYARPAERASEPSRQSSHDSETAERSQYPEHPGNFTESDTYNCNVYI